jgi:hypothetical protein
MPLIPLALPPGMYRNGTDFAAAGRWRDGSLVRWHEGVLMPVKGWSQRSSLPVGARAPRGSHVWRDHANERFLAIGTSNALYVMNAGGVITDITPVGLVEGEEGGQINTAFGGAYYGTASYGIERPENSLVQEAGQWLLDSYGSDLVGCMRADGKLYRWVSDTANAVPVPNAPTGCAALLVTEERFLVGLGAGRNPRKVQWSDRENNELWTPATTNQAGSFELQTSGEIMLGIRTRGQALILTDQDAHTMTYSGPPFVYGFERVGSACGAISRRAAASADTGVIWMGKRGFFKYAGGAVQPVECEVADYVFSDLNRTQHSLIWAVANASYGEIWFFYPSGNSSTCDRYVAYNYVHNHWITGSMSRSAGVDTGIFRSPVWISPTGIIYDHETGDTTGSDIPFVESGPYALGVGDQVLSATQLLPDEKTQGDVTMTFKTRFDPNSTQRSYGPYVMTSPTSVRFTGRQVVVRITGARAASWRVGVPRLNVVPGGER